jgi:hypothetical protein
MTTSACTASESSVGNDLGADVLDESLHRVWSLGGGDGDDEIESREVARHSRADISRPDDREGHVRSCLS